MDPRTSNEASSSIGHSKSGQAMDVDRVRRGGGGSSGGGGGGNDNMLYRKPLPLFLSKIYEMVDDPETNNLISWSATGKSFVIGDHIQFAKDLLPKHFSHDNFSSFVHQLNRYGFNKVTSDRHEYANPPVFQKDSKRLLYNYKIKKRPDQKKKNIKERQLKPPNDDFDAPRKRARQSSSSPHFGADGSQDTEIEKLKNTIDREIWELKQRLAAMEERSAAIEKRVEELFTFMAKAMACPNLFVKNFVKSVAQDSAGEALKDLDLNVKSGEEMKTEKLLEEDDLVWEKSGAEDLVVELEDLEAKPLRSIGPSM